MNSQAGVIAPGAAPSVRVPPSQWPGTTHRDRLRWFIERATPEPNSEHIRRWGLNILSRATEEAAEKLSVTDPSKAIDWGRLPPQIQTPTLLIHGERDVMCDVNVMRYINELIPGSELVIFPGSGHIPAMTRPFEVAKAINGFFSIRLEQSMKIAA